MDNKINLSLDEIISKSGIKFSGKKGFGQRLTKNDTNDNIVIRVDDTSNKRKVDFDYETTVSEETTSDQNCNQNSHFASTSGQIFIENLKYAVNDEDLNQLFGAFGTLKRAAVNFQKDGRSAGTAFVVFDSKSDAETAVNSLQSITLDGRPLQLTLVENKNPFNRINDSMNSRVKRMSKELSGKDKGRHIWSDIARNYDSSPTERTNYRRFNKKEDKDKQNEFPSAEDLDADLESYLAQRKKD